MSPSPYWNIEPVGVFGSMYALESLHTNDAGTIRARLKRAFTAPTTFETGFGFRICKSDVPVVVTMTPFPADVAFMAALKQSLKDCFRGAGLAVGQCGFDSSQSHPLLGASTVSEEGSNHNKGAQNHSVAVKQYFRHASSGDFQHLIKVRFRHGFFM